jgi:cobalt-zinc-cadmium efflux system protein
MHNHTPGDDEACEERLPQRSLKIAIVLTAVIFLAEVTGGFVSGSLALLGDAAHMLQDVVALLLSLGAIIIAGRLPSPSRTFGYHRVEIGAAVVNGFLLIGVSVMIVSEALARFSHPRPIDSTVMFGVAMIGLAANLAAMYILHGSHDLNIRSAFLHVLGDTLSSVAVIVAAIWIAFTGQTFVDPLLSIAIALLILVSSFSLLREAFRILLQFAPPDVDTEAVIRDIESVAGVDGIHNVHLWSLCSNINVLDAHVYSCETDLLKLEAIKQEIKHRLEKYRIRHSTLEFECCECGDCRIVRELRD